MLQETEIQTYQSKSNLTQYFRSKILHTLVANMIPNEFISKFTSTYIRSSMLNGFEAECATSCRICRWERHLKEFKTQIEIGESDNFDSLSYFVLNDQYLRNDTEIFLTWSHVYKL